MFGGHSPSRFLTRTSCIVGFSEPSGEAFWNRRVTRMTYWRHNEIRELSDCQDRAWLISRTDRPVASSAAMPWQRWPALLRRAGRRMLHAAAAIHIAVMAHKARRVRGALARLDGGGQVARHR